MYRAPSLSGVDAAPGVSPEIQAISRCIGYCTHGFDASPFRRY